ncbi:MAG: hypothetical protein ACE5GE_07655, partial [Phycisphaerae bacterium]
PAPKHFSRGYNVLEMSFQIREERERFSAFALTGPFNDNLTFVRFSYGRLLLACTRKNEFAHGLKDIDWRVHGIGIKFGTRPPDPALCGRVLSGLSDTQIQRLQLPESFFILQVPCWLPFALLAPYPVIAFIKGPLRRRHRRKRNRCPQCGNNLEGNITGICSECGTAR